MSSIDVAYYRGRMEEERERAKAAADASIAEIHEELARQYEKLIEHLEGRATRAA
jgi:hypothetical protein